MNYDERLSTPVDDRGLVDHQKLVSCVVPSAKFQSHKSFEDTHHVYWHMKTVLTPNHDTDLAETYRELPINKILMPRYLHEAIHETTVPPRLPDNEVMEYRVEAWKIARTLFQKKQEMQYIKKVVGSWAVSKRRGDFGVPGDDDAIGWEWLKEQKRRNFPGSVAVLHREQQIPSEYLLETDFGPLTEGVVYSISREAKKSAKHKTGRLSLSVLGIELMQTA